MGGASSLQSVPPPESKRQDSQSSGAPVPPAGGVFDLAGRKYCAQDVGYAAGGSVSHRLRPCDVLTPGTGLSVRRGLVLVPLAGGRCSRNGRTGGPVSQARLSRQGGP